MSGKDMVFSAPNIFIYMAALTVLHCLLVETQPVYAACRDVHVAQVTPWHVLSWHSLQAPFFFEGLQEGQGASPFSSVSLHLYCPLMLLPQSNQRKDSDILLSHPALYIFFFSKRLKLSEKMVSPRKLNEEFGFDIFIYCTGTIQWLKDI